MQLLARLVAWETVLLHSFMDGMRRFEIGVFFRAERHPTHRPIQKPKNEPMKRKHWYRKGFTLVELLVVIAIIVALAGLSVPAILRQKKKADMVQATNNAKQIYMLLVDFDQDYGSFPDSTTATQVQNTSGTQPPAGNDANALLAQLIIGGFVQSEEIFFTKTPYTKKPDNVTTGQKVLEAGECGFGYVMMNNNAAMSTASNAGRCVLLTPLLNAAAQEQFDPDPFDGKAVVLRIDGSAKAETISKAGNNAGKVSVGEGRTLLSTGQDSVWGADDQPTVAAPKKKS